MQEKRNSSALAMELRLSCINPLMWRYDIAYNSWQQWAIDSI